MHPAGQQTERDEVSSARLIILVHSNLDFILVVSSIIPVNYNKTFITVLSQGSFLGSALPDSLCVLTRQTSF